MNQPLDVSAYAGVGGNTTAQMLARIATDVIAIAPAWCVVMGGPNDIAGGSATAAQIETNLRKIYDLLLVNKIRVVACTLVPSVNYDTQAKSDDYFAVNAWLKGQLSGNAMVVCNSGETYLDTGAPLAAPLAGYTHDGIHPTALGAWALGDAIADAMIAYLSARDLFVASDSVKLIKANSYLTGTGGTELDGATGDTATGWYSHYGVFSKVVRGDGFGEWQQCVLDETGRVTLNCDDIAAGFAEGDTLLAQCEIETDNDWSGVTEFQLSLQFRDVSSALASRGDLLTHPNSGSVVTNPGACILRSVPTAVPAGTTLIRPYVTLAGTAGTVRVGRFEIRKL